MGWLVGWDSCTLYQRRTGSPLGGVDLTDHPPLGIDQFADAQNMVLFAAAMGKFVMTELGKSP